MSCEISDNWNYRRKLNFDLNISSDVSISNNKTSLSNNLIQVNTIVTLS